jgi:CHASE2 domain-containing sensor protein
MLAKKLKKNRAAPKESDLGKPDLTTRTRARVRPLKWRWSIAGLLFLSISAVVFFASFVSFFNALKIDDAVKGLLVYYVGTKVENKFDKRLEVVLVSQNAQPAGPSGQIDPAHRHYYAEMIKALTESHARMVVFDMEFAKEPQDQKIDQEFADAVERTRGSGTTILVAADLDEGQTEPIFSPTLEMALKDHWGIWDGGKAKGTASVRLVRLGLDSPGQRDDAGERKIIPSLALEVVKRTRYAGQNLQAFFSPLTGQVRLREGGPDGRVVNRFPVDNDLYFLVDMAGENEMGRHPSFFEVYSQRANPNYMRIFKDKIVIIGYEKDDEKQISESPNDKRFGADIQASAMSNLLQDSYVRPLSLLANYFVILFMVVLGGVLRIKFCKLMNYKLPIKLPDFVPTIIKWEPQVPTVLVILSVLYFFVALFAYRFEKTIFTMSYHLAALFLGYLLTGVVCSRLGFK